METAVLQLLAERHKRTHKTLAVLVDPDKFDPDQAAEFVRGLPAETDMLFVGGSEVADGETQKVVRALKFCTSRPVIIFPGNARQICHEADALLYLSLLSGDNAEYLVGQQVKGAALLRESDLEVIPVGYILIDGGHDSAVQKVTGTLPIPSGDISRIVDTAFAGQLMGKKLIYLEAGSGARNPVPANVIKEVRTTISIPLIVGGGIRTIQQRELAFESGADLVVMGNVFE